MNNHVDFLKPEEQKKWLKQRGWITDGASWRDPDLGISFGFAAALDRAKKACRLPADFELRPTG